MNKKQLRELINKDTESFLLHGGIITECKPARPRKGEKTFTLDKALYNRPERRGDSRRRSYVSTNERRA
jgi:hypothetical protein